MPECTLFQKVLQSMDKLAHTQSCKATPHPPVVAGAPPVGVKEKSGRESCVSQSCVKVKY